MARLYYHSVHSLLISLSVGLLMYPAGALGVGTAIDPGTPDFSSQSSTEGSGSPETHDSSEDQSVSGPEVPNSKRTRGDLSGFTAPQDPSEQGNLTSDNEETSPPTFVPQLESVDSIEVKDIGLTWLVRTEDIAVGAAVTPNLPRLEYRWMQYDIAQDTWALITDWQSGNWAAWKSTPGVYWLHLELRDRLTQTIVGTKTIPFHYSAGTTQITGTYAGGRDSGILLGMSSNNPRARFEIKIYDVGKSQWVTGFSGQWAVWYPEKGLYWTHFEVYTSDGRLAQTRTYAFGVGLAGYTAPAGYLDVTDHITPLNGQTNTLTPGFNGVKVRIVQQALGIWYPMKLASMETDSVAAVRRFQRRAGLPADGVVGPNTWNALGTGWQWDIDTFQAAPLPISANRHERIEKMLEFAWMQSGADYVWGGAGTAPLGYDCSGLVLQSLYVGGLDPQPINVLYHAYPHYRTSQELYKHPRLMHVPTSQRERGDIVFYVDGTGTVVHTGLYLGGDQIVHTDWMGRPARVDSIYQGNRLAPTVVRPFP